MKETLLNVLTGTLALCAVIVTVLAVRAHFYSAPGEELPATVTEDTWNAILSSTDDGATSDSPVKIVEFFDYQCTYCRTTHQNLSELKRIYGESISIYYKHYPLLNNDTSYRLAGAAECAREQRQFEPFHNAVFENQQHLGVIPIDSLAIVFNIADPTLFNSCMNEERYSQVISNHTAIAAETEISSVPVTIINGRRINGAVPIDVLSQVIEEELQKASL
jgi:protein-disulfide isomerase